MPIIRIKENNPLIIEVLRNPNSEPVETFKAEGFQIGRQVRVKKQNKDTHGNPTEIGERQFDKGSEEIEIDLR